MTSLNTFSVAATSSGLTTATTAYSAGDTMGALFSWVIPSSATGAIITNATLHDKSDVTTGAYALYLFDRSVTFGTDNAAPSISDADNFFAIGVIYFQTPDDLGGNRLSSVDSLAITVVPNASSTIYGGLVTLAGHTFFGAATDLQIRLSGTKDV